ncbi:MAG: hypothetical protein IIV78_03965, partial [Oscillospiraceae bacterium]|nr:hypothetical protein [Oscillospiraceae bacterium]
HRPQSAQRRDAKHALFFEKLPNAFHFSLRTVKFLHKNSTFPLPFQQKAPYLEKFLQNLQKVGAFFENVW